MSSALASSFEALLQRYDWVRGLAGILPLSALIEFVNVSQKLHVLQLNGECPLWSWPITPSAARLLLSLEDEHTDCFLDRFGQSGALLAMDGRYGDQYTVSNPETVRMCISTQSPHLISNNHQNMKRQDSRTQILDVVHLTCADQSIRSRRQSRFWRRFISFDRFSAQYCITSIAGWIILFGLIATTVVFECWLALVFFILMPCSGCLVTYMYGRVPMDLLVHNNGNPYNRAIVVADNWNTSKWTLFYGQSTILNSLLNRPLIRRVGQMSKTQSKFCRFVLRVLVLGQWILAVGSAASKDWNAYLISLWILVSILVHSYVITPEIAAKDWMKASARFRLTSYRTRLSSRRSLVNTIVALNPDTFHIDNQSSKDDTKQFNKDGIKWIDRVIEQSASRNHWEIATLKDMQELSHQTLNRETSKGPEKDASVSSEQFAEGGKLSENWYSEFPVVDCYWSPFIPEGLYMADKIRTEANLCGRYVNDVSGDV